MKSAVVRRSHDSLDDDSLAEEALEQGTLAFGSAPKETGIKIHIIICIYINNTPNIGLLKYLFSLALT